MHISMTREELMARLTEQLAMAKAEDARRAERHKKDEAAALAKFRAKLKTALGWDYKKVKEASYRELQMDEPSCPMLEARRFERLILSVKLDTRQGKFTLSDHADLHEAVTWIPASKRPKATVCD